MRHQRLFRQFSTWMVGKPYPDGQANSIGLAQSWICGIREALPDGRGHPTRGYRIADDREHRTGRFGDDADRAFWLDSQIHSSAPCAVGEICGRLCATKARRRIYAIALISPKQLCCTRDEGWPLELGLQDQGSNHRLLLRSNDRGGERDRKRQGMTLSGEG